VNPSQFNPKLPDGTWQELALLDSMAPSLQLCSILFCCRPVKFLPWGSEQGPLRQIRPTWRLQSCRILDTNNKHQFVKHHPALSIHDTVGFLRNNLKHLEQDFRCCASGQLFLPSCVRRPPWIEFRHVDLLQSVRRQASMTITLIYHEADCIYGTQTSKAARSRP